MNDNIVIVAAARTAVGNFGGTISGIPAAELGAKVIAGLLARPWIRNHTPPSEKGQIP